MWHFGWHLVVCVAASVVKLVYTKDLKSFAYNGLRVQVPPLAPDLKSVHPIFHPYNNYEIV
jgi:hypothetical protein